MAASEAAIHLAGFVLSHAAWSISDLPNGELLVPLAITESGGTRKLLRFEAETQEEAIAEGKKYLAEQQAAFSAWAFAREGQVDTGNGYLDVLSVDAWAEGLQQPIIFVQPFQPFSSGTFKLLGSAVPVVGGAMLSPTESEPYLTILYRGISSHSQAAELWPSWQTDPGTDYFSKF